MFFEACQRAVVVLAAFWCAFLVFAIALAVLPLESLQADPALRSLITASMMGVRAHMLSAGRLAGQEYFQQACQIVVESANLSFCTIFGKVVFSFPVIESHVALLYEYLVLTASNTQNDDDSLQMVVASAPTSPGYSACPYSP
ncbi:hypothetical protein B484DRAFT_426179 [Ochromonadaceae sp. CCMP2298]|nr:hypothetical protein B484DRAFT_426179 [Ochromonadaceae sp. CCMP2298]